MPSPRRPQSQHDTVVAADRMGLPRSVRLVAWGNAAMLGRVSLDDAVEHAVGTDTVHRVVGLPDESGQVGLTLTLGRLRAEGVRGLRLALPVPGDPLGLFGPPDLTCAATEAGEAVLSEGLPAYGLVPETQRLGSSGTAVRWTVAVAAPAPTGQVPTLAEAERDLSGAVREATDLLVELDVARSDAAATASVARLREGDGLADALAPGYPARAHRVLRHAALIQLVAALARRSTGGALTAGQAARRDAALAPLERTSRRALVAACNCVHEPGHR